MDLLPFKSFLFLLSVAGCGANILPPGPLYLRIGENVTFEITLEWKPTVVIWKVDKGDNNPINIVNSMASAVNMDPDYKPRASLNTENGFLTLSALTEADSGVYMVDVMGSTAEALNGERRLLVLGPVSDVVIKSSDSEPLEHNSTVVLTCSATGSSLTFTWTNATVPMEADGKRISVDDKGDSSMLTIAGVLRWDLNGPIYCTASNELDTEKSAPFNLTVYYGPDKAIIVPPDPPKYVKSDSTFNLYCSAASEPPATFSWYHGEDMLEVSGPMLSLTDLEEQKLGEEMGNYHCKASNAKTQRRASSDIVTFAVMKAISGSSITGPSLTLIAGNSSANLSCQATSGAVETWSWMKDNGPLSASGRVVLADDESSILIDPVEKDDNGEYKCQLTNPVSSDSATYNLIVNFGPEAAVVTGAEAVEVNSPVKLTCFAESVPPANYTWKFNGTIMNNPTDVYTIEKAVYKNSGMYLCEAHNPVTGKTTVTTHKLSVKEEGALDKTLSDGAIAGIVIAILIALGAVIALVMYCRQKTPIESPY